MHRLKAASAHVVSTNFRNQSVSGGPNAAGGDAVIEVADLPDVVPGEPGTEAWAMKAKVALQQFFKQFGPVLDVRVPTSVAKVRFGTAKTADAVMKAAPRGFLFIGEGEVRVRQPGSSLPVLQKFPPPRRSNPTLAEAKPATISKKRKERPNERFATRVLGREEPDESERFWEEQHEKRREAAAGGALPPIQVGEAASNAAAPEQFPVVPPEPERPSPTPLSSEASAEDRAVFEGEKAVVAAMASLLEQPFSQQRKTLKNLRRQWHPDKRPDDQEVATRVFQFIQAHDDWLAHHGLA